MLISTPLCVFTSITSTIRRLPANTAAAASKHLPCLHLCKYTDTSVYNLSIYLYRSVLSDCRETAGKEDKRTVPASPWILRSSESNELTWDWTFCPIWHWTGQLVLHWDGDSSFLLYVNWCKQKYIKNYEEVIQYGSRGQARQIALQIILQFSKHPYVSQDAFTHVQKLSTESKKLPCITVNCWTFPVPVITSGDESTKCHRGVSSHFGSLKENWRPYFQLLKWQTYKSH